MVNVAGLNIIKNKKCDSSRLTLFHNICHVSMSTVVI